VPLLLSDYYSDAPTSACRSCRFLQCRKAMRRREKKLYSLKSDVPILPTIPLVTSPERPQSFGQQAW
jgi:hypothetical protein